MRDATFFLFVGIDYGQPWRRTFGDNIVYTDWKRDNYYYAVQQQVCMHGLKRIVIGHENILHHLSGLITWYTPSEQILRNSLHYYMAASASGQDEASPMFSLATRAAKMGLSCPLGIARFVPAKAKHFGVIYWP